MDDWKTIEETKITNAFFFFFLNTGKNQVYTKISSILMQSLPCKHTFMDHHNALTESLCSVHITH